MRLRFSVFATAALLSSALLATACTDYNDPSSFNNQPTDGGGGDGGRPGDAGVKGDAPNLVGDGAPGSFQCGSALCPHGDYCVRILGDSGVEQSAACYPLLQCNDCPCVTNVVATSACQGDTLGCAGTPGADLYVTCEQGAPSPGDAAAGG